MKKLLIVIICTIVLAGISLLIFYCKNKEFVDYLNRGVIYEYKIFPSPNKVNTLTILVENKGDLLDYESFIYIIKGEHTKKSLPKGNHFIKFPNDTGVYLNWDDDELCTIVSDKNPEINNLGFQEFKVNLMVDKSRIRELTKEGKVYRYSTKPLRSQTGCSSNKPFELKGLKNSYSQGEIICFELINNLSEQIFFTVGTQKMVNEKWKEDVPDIKEKEHSMKVKLQEFAPAEKLNLLWDVTNTFSVYKDTPGQYRLFINYSNKKDMKFQKYFSDVFSIKE